MSFNIFIKSTLKATSKTYALKITATDYTVFQIKKDIETIGIHAEAGIRENDTLWLNFVINTMKNCIADI